MNAPINRITPKNIKPEDLGENDYFVFGSNESGIHGAGAAFFAHRELGAEWGLAEGISGKTYALPTVSRGIKRTLTIPEISVYADDFIEFAKNNPDDYFYLTEVGCGLGGLTPTQVAPLFINAALLHNVSLPQRFWDVLNR